MGACVSGNAAVGIGTSEAPAILVLCISKEDSGHTGKGGAPFVKYAEKVRVAEAIKEHRREEECFICSWDSVLVGETITELQQWQELESGEIYFLLPRRKLNFAVTFQDISYFLLKAASALKSLPFSPLLSCDQSHHHEDKEVQFSAPDEMPFADGKKKKGFALKQNGKKAITVRDEIQMDLSFGNHCRDRIKCFFIHIKL